MKIDIDLIGWDNGVESHGLSAVPAQADETAKVLESHGSPKATPVCSTVRSIERKVAKEALLAAFDMLADDGSASIFRDEYGIVLKDNPRQIILEVETEDDYICYVWQDGQWHDVEGRAARKASVFDG